MRFIFLIIIFFTISVTSCKQNKKTEDSNTVDQDTVVVDTKTVNDDSSFSKYYRTNNPDESEASLKIKFNEDGQHYNFELGIFNSSGCTGKLSGIAKPAPAEGAIFSDENCKELVFQFIYLADKDEEIIQVIENKCNYYHGNNCMFEGEYAKK